MRIVPGERAYNEIVAGNKKKDESDRGVELRERIDILRDRRNRRETNTLVFASSMTRDIVKQSFKEDCNGSVHFHEFKGKPARDIVDYMLTHVMQECPRTVVLVCGGNDLPNHVASSKKLHEIAEYMVKGCLDVKNRLGVENVLISSIMPRENSVFQGNRHQMNLILQKMCEENGLGFINNKNIILSKHITWDGTHLNDQGTNILRQNLLEAINNVV